MRLKNGRRGVSILSYCLLIFSIIVILYVFALLILKLQISIEILSVRNDLFFIAQNSEVALNKELLSYNEYSMDSQKMEEIIKELINSNYGDKVELKNVYYDYSTNEVNIEVSIFIKPIISYGVIREKNVNVQQKVKLKLLGVN